MLVDDLDLAVAHQILLVAQKQVPRGQGLGHELAAAPLTGPKPAQRLGDVGEALLAAIEDLDLAFARMQEEVGPLAQLAAEKERLPADFHLLLALRLS